MVRVDGFSIDEREWEREACPCVALQVDIENRSIANTGVVDRVKNLHLHLGVQTVGKGIGTHLGIHTP